MFRTGHLALRTNSLAALALGCAFVCLVPAATNAQPSYGFSISASSTDPNVHTGPPREGIYELFLWMDESDPPLEKPGIASFDGEVRPSGDLIFVAFAPAAGWMNAVGGARLFLAVQQCPSGPLLAGRLIVRGVENGEGSICLGRAESSGTLGAVDCRPSPEIWDVRVRGYSTDGTSPCCVLCRDWTDSNLEIVSFTAPGSASRGEDLSRSLEVELRNSGAVDIDQEVSVTVLLSAGPNVTSLDDALGEGRATLAGLPAGTRKRVTFPAVFVPEDQALDVNYVSVMADESDRIPEGIEADNVAALPIAITASAPRAESGERPGLTAVRFSRATALAGETVRIPLQGKGTGELDRFELSLSCPTSLDVIGVELAEATRNWSAIDPSPLTIGVVGVASSGPAVRLDPERWTTLAHLVVRVPAEPVGSLQVSLTETSVERKSVRSFAGEIEVLEPVPSRVDLAPVRRNPADGTFSIEFRIPEGVSREIEIAIYGPRGDLVKSLLKGRRGPGRHGLRWDGTDWKEKPVAPGVYFVRMTAPSFQKTQKLVLE